MTLHLLHFNIHSMLWDYMGSWSADVLSRNTEVCAFLPMLTLLLTSSWLQLWSLVNARLSMSNSVSDCRIPCQTVSVFDALPSGNSFPLILSLTPLRLEISRPCMNEFSVCQFRDYITYLSLVPSDPSPAVTLWLFPSQSKHRSASS